MSETKFQTHTEPRLKTEFYEKLVGGRMRLPPPKKPQNGTTDVPRVFVGDEDLTLLEDFLKPLAKRI
jgi:hypothetical protein